MTDGVAYSHLSERWVENLVVLRRLFRDVRLKHGKIEMSTGSRHVETATVRAHLDRSEGQCLTTTLKTTSILLANNET